MSHPMPSHGGSSASAPKEFLLLSSDTAWESLPQPSAWVGASIRCSVGLIEEAEHALQYLPPCSVVLHAECNAAKLSDGNKLFCNFGIAFQYRSKVFYRTLKSTRGSPITVHGLGNRTLLITEAQAFKLLQELRQHFIPQLQIVLLGAVLCPHFVETDIIHLDYEAHLKKRPYVLALDRGDLVLLTRLSMPGGFPQHGRATFPPLAQALRKPKRRKVPCGSTAPTVAYGVSYVAYRIVFDADAAVMTVEPPLKEKRLAEVQQLHMATLWQALPGLQQVAKQQWRLLFLSAPMKRRRSFCLTRGKSLALLQLNDILRCVLSDLGIPPALCGLPHPPLWPGVLLPPAVIVNMATAAIPQPQGPFGRDAGASGADEMPLSYGGGAEAALGSAGPGEGRSGQRWSIPDGIQDVDGEEKQSDDQAASSDSAEEKQGAADALAAGHRGPGAAESVLPQALTSQRGKGLGLPSHGGLHLLIAALPNCVTAYVSAASAQRLSRAWVSAQAEQKMPFGGSATPRPAPVKLRKKSSHSTDIVELGHVAAPSSPVPGRSHRSAWRQQGSGGHRRSSEHVVTRVCGTSAVEWLWHSIDAPPSLPQQELQRTFTLYGVGHGGDGAVQLPSPPQSTMGSGQRRRSSGSKRRPKLWPSALTSVSVDGSKTFYGGKRWPLRLKSGEAPPTSNHGGGSGIGGISSFVAEEAPLPPPSAAAAMTLQTMVGVAATPVEWSSASTAGDASMLPRVQQGVLLSGNGSRWEELSRDGGDGVPGGGSTLGGSEVEGSQLQVEEAVLHHREVFTDSRHGLSREAVEGNRSPPTSPGVGISSAVGAAAVPPPVSAAVAAAASVTSPTAAALAPLNRYGRKRNMPAVYEGLPSLRSGQGERRGMSRPAVLPGYSVEVSHRTAVASEAQPSSDAAEKGKKKKKPMRLSNLSRLRYPSTGSSFFPGPAVEEGVTPSGLSLHFYSPMSARSAASDASRPGSVDDFKAACGHLEAALSRLFSRTQLSHAEWMNVMKCLVAWGRGLPLLLPLHATAADQPQCLQLIPLSAAVLLGDILGKFLHQAAKEAPSSFRNMAAVLDPLLRGVVETTEPTALEPLAALLMAVLAQVVALPQVQAWLTMTDIVPSSHELLSSLHQHTAAAAQPFEEWVQGFAAQYDSAHGHAAEAPELPSRPATPHRRRSLLSRNGNKDGAMEAPPSAPLTLDSARLTDPSDSATESLDFVAAAASEASDSGRRPSQCSLPPPGPAAPRPSIPRLNLSRLTRNSTKSNVLGLLGHSPGPFTSTSAPYVRSTKLQDALLLFWDLSEGRIMPEDLRSFLFGLPIGHFDQVGDAASPPAPTPSKPKASPTAPILPWLAHLSAVFAPLQQPSVGSVEGQRRHQPSSASSSARSSNSAGPSDPTAAMRDRFLAFCRYATAAPANDRHQDAPLAPWTSRSHSGLNQQGKPRHSKPFLHVSASASGSTTSSLQPPLLSQRDAAIVEAAVRAMPAAAYFTLPSLSSHSSGGAALPHLAPRNGGGLGCFHGLNGRYTTLLHRNPGGPEMQLRLGLMRCAVTHFLVQSLDPEQQPSSEAQGAASEPHEDAWLSFPASSWRTVSRAAELPSDAVIALSADDVTATGCNAHLMMAKFGLSLWLQDEEGHAEGGDSIESSGSGRTTFRALLVRSLSVLLGSYSPLLEFSQLSAASTPIAASSLVLKRLLHQYMTASHALEQHTGGGAAAGLQAASWLYLQCLVPLIAEAAALGSRIALPLHLTDHLLATAKAIVAVEEAAAAAATPAPLYSAIGAAHLVWLCGYSLRHGEGSFSSQGGAATTMSVERLRGLLHVALSTALLSADESSNDGGEGAAASTWTAMFLSAWEETVEACVASLFRAVAGGAARCGALEPPEPLQSQSLLLLQRTLSLAGVPLTATDAESADGVYLATLLASLGLVGCALEMSPAGSRPLGMPGATLTRTVRLYDAVLCVVLLAFQMWTVPVRTVCWPTARALIPLLAYRAGAHIDVDFYANRSQDMEGGVAAAASQEQWFWLPLSEAALQLQHGFQVGQQALDSAGITSWLTFMALNDIRWTATRHIRFESVEEARELRFHRSDAGEGGGGINGAAARDDGAAFPASLAPHSTRARPLMRGATAPRPQRNSAVVLSSEGSNLDAAAATAPRQSSKGVALPSQRRPLPAIPPLSVPGTAVEASSASFVSSRQPSHGGAAIARRADAPSPSNTNDPLVPSPRAAAAPNTSAEAQQRNHAASPPAVGENLAPGGGSASTGENHAVISTEESATGQGAASQADDIPESAPLPGQKIRVITMNTPRSQMSSYSWYSSSSGYHSPEEGSDEGSTDEGSAYHDGDESGHSEDDEGSHEEGGRAPHLPPFHAPSVPKLNITSDLLKSHKAAATATTTEDNVLGDFDFGPTTAKAASEDFGPDAVGEREGEGREGEGGDEMQENAERTETAEPGEESSQMEIGSWLSRVPTVGAPIRRPNLRGINVKLAVKSTKGSSFIMEEDSEEEEGRASRNAANHVVTIPPLALQTVASKVSNTPTSPPTVNHVFGEGNPLQPGRGHDNSHHDSHPHASASSSADVTECNEAARPRLLPLALPGTSSESPTGQSPMLLLSDSVYGLPSLSSWQIATHRNKDGGSTTSEAGEDGLGGGGSSRGLLGLSILPSQRLDVPPGGFFTGRDSLRGSDWEALAGEDGDDIGSGRTGRQGLTGRLVVPWLRRRWSTLSSKLYDDGGDGWADDGASTQQPPSQTTTGRERPGGAAVSLVSRVPGRLRRTSLDSKASHRGAAQSLRRASLDEEEKDAAPGAGLGGSGNGKEGSGRGNGSGSSPSHYHSEAKAIGEAAEWMAELRNNEGLAARVFALLLRSMVCPTGAGLRPPFSNRFPTLGAAAASGGDANKTARTAVSSVIGGGGGGSVMEVAESIDYGTRLLPTFDDADVTAAALAEELSMLGPSAGLGLGSDGHQLHWHQGGGSSGGRSRLRSAEDPNGRPRTGIGPRDVGQRLWHRSPVLPGIAVPFRLHQVIAALDGSSSARVSPKHRSNPSAFAESLLGAAVFGNVEALWMDGWTAGKSAETPAALDSTSRNGAETGKEPLPLLQVVPPPAIWSPAPALECLVRLLTRSLFDTRAYVLSDTIARGAFGEVREAIVQQRGSHRATAMAGIAEVLRRHNLQPLPLHRRCAAQELLPGEVVAVKLVPLQREESARCVLPELLREVVVLCYLSTVTAAEEKWPLCPALLDFGVGRGHYWIVQQRCGQSLRRWRRLWGRLKHEHLPVMLQLFGEICRCVAQLHRHGIHHYDVKADNVLFRATPEALDALLHNHTASELLAMPQFQKNNLCFADFGESTFFPGIDVAQTSAPTTRARGTDCIKSPEMLRTGGLSAEHQLANADRRRRGGAAAASDVWSLGCLLYELLVGEYLFRDMEFAQYYVIVTSSGPLEQGQFKDLPDSLFQTHPEVWHLFQMLFLKDPSRRPTALQAANLAFAAKDRLVQRIRKGLPPL